MNKEENIDWLCRLRADLNNGVIYTPWNKEFTEALNNILEQDPCDSCTVGGGTDNYESKIFKKYSPSYVMECIQFTELVRGLPNCNNCLKHGVCEYLPKPGDWIRYNCYAYLGPKTDTNVTKNCDILVESEDRR